MAKQKENRWKIAYAPHDYLEIDTYLFTLFSTIKITQTLNYTKMWQGDLKKPQGLYEEVPSTHNNGGYKTHYQYNKKSKTFVLNDCNKKIELIEFGREFQIFGP